MDMDNFFSYIREKYISTTLLCAIIVRLMGHPTLPLKATAPNDEWEQTFYQIISPLTLCVANLSGPWYIPDCVFCCTWSTYTRRTRKNILECFARRRRRASITDLVSLLLSAPLLTQRLLQFWRKYSTGNPTAPIICQDFDLVEHARLDGSMLWRWSR
jgi:hypothetical protein